MMRSHAKLLSLLNAVLFLAGCGTQVTTFPAQIRAADGTPIYLEDVRAIVDDASLSVEQQRQALRDLGMEDEGLITAIVGG